ncbi:MAG: LAGLIDADG family homing endonuclease, partial [Steroidobacteraceae bacterium]
MPQAIFMAPKESVRLFLQALFGGDGGLYQSGGGCFLEYYSSSRRLIEDVHHLLLRFGVLSLIREKTTAIGTRAYRIQITDREQIQRFAAEIGFVPGSVKQQRLANEILPLIVEQPRARSNFDTFPNGLWPTLRAVAGEASVTPHSLSIALNARQSVPHGAVVWLAQASDDEYMSRLAAGPLWDVVEQIEPAGVEEVYDICVPMLHNFVANGLIVHNSTYARCFSANTRVALVDGTAATLEEMARRSASGEMFWGYSIGPLGRLIVTLLEAPRFIGRDALVEVVLDNGVAIHATPDHLFLMRDGRLRAAGDLRPGDSLMPLYRGLRRGYEMVYQPINGHLYPTHRLADEWNVRHGIYADTAGTHRHHMDHDRRNNRPTNLERMLAADHIRLHNAETFGDAFDAAEHGAAIRA